MRKRKTPKVAPLPLFAAESLDSGGPAVLDSSWDPTLTHRMRVLLHARPLIDLHRNDALQDQDRRHYDGLALAVKVLDLIVSRTGLDREVDSKVAAKELSPLLEAMDRSAGCALDAARQGAVVDRVLAALRNDAEGRRPFSIEYTDFGDDGEALRRHLEFSLVQDVHHPSGGAVMRLTNEAANLYLSALELDIEDAQAATEAIIQSQLNRGKLDEAVQSARNARLQSIRFRDKIERRLRETRRDLARVDWREEIPNLIQDAIRHLQGRQSAESAILESATERLDQLDTGDPKARKITEVKTLVEDCQVRHAQLHHHLMEARNVFLDEQERQDFAPRPRTFLPELGSDVLEPILRSDRHTAEEALATAFPLFVGPRPPVLFDLRDLVMWQLRPKREAPVLAIAAVEVDPAPILADLVRYLPVHRAQASAYLAALEGSVPLSTILRQANAEGAPPEVLEILVLLALAGFGPEGQNQPFRAERRDGPLDVFGFYGDDLELTPVYKDAPLSQDPGSTWPPPPADGGPS